MNYLLKTSCTFRTVMSCWNIDPCLENECCPFGLGDNLHFQHYTKNVNTGANRRNVCMCVWVGGCGGVWPCVSGSPNVCSVLAEVWEPAVVVGGGGGTFFLSKHHCYNPRRQFSPGHVNWHVVDSLPMGSCNQKILPFRDPHSPSSG